MGEELKNQQDMASRAWVWPKHLEAEEEVWEWGQAGLHGKTPVFNVKHKQ